MGFVPPPMPLTSKEFNKRWEAGARTLEELDPALAKWARGGVIGLLFRKKNNKILQTNIETIAHKS